MFRLLWIVALLAMTVAAQAHTGIGGTSGFDHGFVHPFAGLDHVLAMVAVGLFAAQLGRLALWQVPLSFLALMAIGGAIGMAGVDLPFAELGIAVSVIVLGIAVAMNRHVPTAAAMALAAAFAVFHGYAHGAEMPIAAAGVIYGLGFLAATAILHGCGIGIGLLLRDKAQLLRYGGGAIAAIGLVILAGLSGAG